MAVLFRAPPGPAASALGTSPHLGSPRGHPRAPPLRLGGPPLWSEPRLPPRGPGFHWLREEVASQSPQILTPSSRDHFRRRARPRPVYPASRRRGVKMEEYAREPW